MPIIDHQTEVNDLEALEKKHGWTGSTHVILKGEEGEEDLAILSNPNGNEILIILINSLNFCLANLTSSELIESGIVLPSNKNEPPKRPDSQ